MTVQIQSLNATIAISTTTSDALCIQEYNMGSFQIPAAITGTTLTIHVSNDNSNFVALQDAAGSAIAAVPVSANESCPFPAAAFNFKYAKFVSNQTELAARTIAVLLKAA